MGDEFLPGLKMARDSSMHDVKRLLINPLLEPHSNPKRLIIPADGFYEWKKEGKQKQPYYFRQGNGKPFALAGLYDTWRLGDEKITTFTILTTDANETMNPIHNRMPVILLEEDYDEWLDVNQTDKEKLSRMLKPYPAERMEGYPVQTMVNSPTNDRQQKILSQFRLGNNLLFK
ncbi:MAG: SOS response-associated peptidase [bacterium]